MMRPTHSPTLYTQQLGRALSAGKDTTPIVIDLVNNIDSIQIMRGFFGNLDGNIRSSNLSSNVSSPKESFRISEQIRNIMELVEKIDTLVSRSTQLSYEEKLEIMKRYIEETGEKIHYDTLYEGYNIGSWQVAIRYANKNGKLVLTDEIKNGFMEIGVLKENISKKLQNARKIKA